MPSPHTKRLKAAIGTQRITEDHWREEIFSIADDEDADAPRVSQWVDEDDLNDEEDELTKEGLEIDLDESYNIVDVRFSMHASSWRI